ncbi:hypothetical protein HH310_33910 [Actinoplanes sp. TBRC 11911]|uniref:hypothetical protein n=1 Tax=Actinoplanes sp. TBRC 11911 TaxID=2729386 RepID=UPI00145DED66|nr:hypothetical protein [Actinoplanes sp. TBRC 11911]NMO56161.1 hypothetical protein [Actinoplanes sp. TBRC 11911]
MNRWTALAAWSAAGLVVILSLVFAITHRASDAPPGAVDAPLSAVRITDDCDNPGQIKPTTIQLTCGDGSAVLNDLTWSDWGETTATGEGVLNQVDCDPSCVEGHDVSTSVPVVLSQPAPAENGTMYFTRISVGDQVFQSCWAEPPAPYLPACPPTK